jgi:hypothetical protein
LTRELPNNVPFSAKVQLIRRFTASWKGMARVLLAAGLPIVEALLNGEATKVFASHAEGRLVGRVQ